MSNLTEKNTPKRDPLSRICSTNSQQTENPPDLENTLARMGFSSAVKNFDESKEMKKKVITKPKKESPEELELVKVLKNNLKEAMDENDMVKSLKISFFH